MKLFYAPGACSIGIHVLLEEIGKPYEAQLVNLREGGQFKPDFTAVNPKSKVPTLVPDDGSVLTEYPAIAYYLARTNPDMPKHHGITFLLVEMDDPAIEVRPLIQATGAAHFNEVFFDNVRVPVANVLGDIDNGWPAARTVMANESAMIGGGLC